MRISLGEIFVSALEVIVPKNGVINETTILILFIMKICCVYVDKQNKHIYFM